MLKNDEAVSELIGAILLVAIAVIFLGLIQTVQVPEWNKAIEIQHADLVYDDFLKLKSNIEDSAVHGFPKTSTIHMGTSFPNRVVLRNPADKTAGMLLIKPDKWIRINYTTQGTGSSTLFEEDYEAGAVSLVAYDGIHGNTQHSTPTNMNVQSTTVHNDTYALDISGNDWQEQTFTSFTLTNSTNMTVWIRGDEEAEIQAIGVADGTGSSRHSVLYKIWGTQADISDTNWVNSPYQDMYAPDGTWHSYELPIGSDWYDKWGSYESIDRIVYVQDNDAAPTSGRMYIDDISITNETVATNITSTNLTSSTITYSPSYCYFDESPKTVYEHGLAIRNYSINNFTYTETTQTIVDEDSLNVIWTNSTENSFGSSESKGLISKYISDSSTSVEGANVSVTIYTSYPELWNNSLSDVSGITTSIDGNEVTVTYPSSQTIDILTKGVEISFTQVTSTTATSTPAPTPDTTPPASITSLTNSTYAETYINWVWTNPSDSDFSYTMTYIDGVWSANTSLQYYNATGFNASESHTISTHTVDTTGNINTTWVNHTATTAPPDTTPPASITSLTNSTYAETYINWTWTNPGDSDFNYTMVYIDGTWTTNTSSQFHNATGFSGNENHTISTHTVDTNGNINSTWVNHTATTGPTTTTYDATDGRSYFRAYGTYSDAWSDLDGVGGTQATLPNECDTEVTDVLADAYTRLGSSDAAGGDADTNRYINPDESGGAESTMIVHIWVDESVSSITQLSFDWEGYGDATHTLRLYVFNYTENNWDGGESGFKDSGSGDADFSLDWNTTSGIDDYINNNNQLAFLILDTSGNEDSFHDYVKLDVAHTTDSTPPVISNVTVTGTTHNSTTITWDTDEPSDSIVKNGTESGNYSQTTSNSSYVRSHSIDLSGLNVNTTYYYVVNSTNPEGYTNQSTEYTFTTTEKTYDATDGRSYFKAYGTYSDAWSDLDGVGGTQASLPNECDTEVTDVLADAYTRLSYSDATGGDSDTNRYINPDEDGGDESTMIVHIWIDEEAADITQLYFQWEGYGDATHTLRLYVFNYTAGNWDGGETGFKDSGSGDADFLLEWNATSGFDNYINGNDQLAFLILDISDNEDSFHDYAKLEVKT